jgi:hypothetical protein
MSDEQDGAEALDDDVIADDEAPDPDGADDDRFVEIAALEEEYPPDQPLGVEDPGRYEIEDDLATRSSRTEPDPGEA